MDRNVGTADRVIRVVVGLALLSLVFFWEGNARWWGLIGLAPLATGLVGWCALYRLLGIGTSRGRRGPGAPLPG